MSGSKYNEGYSFNPSTFLYLQPEIQVREDIKTVEEAKEYYDSVKDDPNMVVEIDTYIWSTVNIPKRFDALIYLIAHKYEMNTSPLNEAIRLSMQIDKFSYCEINDGGNFQPTIKSVSKLIDDDVFQFDVTGSFMIKDESLKIGDIVQIQAVGNNLTFQTVTVIEIIDQYTVKMKSKDPEKTFSDIGRPYEVIGIYIYDLERLSRINYLRYLIENDDPQSIISVLDTEFNSRLYQTLYPVTRNLDEYSAYQDYIENRIEDDNTIGKVDDIIRVIRNLSSTDSNDTGPSSIFTDITVTEKVILDFNATGYIKFNDQYVYYITNNHIRPSRDINNAFPGLITEWAIKKYFEDKIAETVEDTFLEFLKTEDSFEFGGDAIINGNFSALGESNLIMNAQLCNADIVSADIVGIDGEDAMIYINRDSNVIAYIHEDGMFLSSYLGVNVDIPQHNVDICGDLAVSGPVYFGSNIVICGEVEGLYGIEGDSMIFMTQDLDVIAYLTEETIVLGKPLGINTDDPQYDVDIVGDFGVSGPAFLGSNLEVKGAANFDSMVSIGIVPQDIGNKLFVGGSIRATGNIIAEETVFSESDVRLKSNITPIQNPYEIVKGMNGVMYSLKRDQVEPAKRYCGLIAQEVEKVLPEVVEVQSNGMLSLAYGNIVGVLVEAVKKLISENEAKEEEQKEEKEEIEITANLVRDVKDLKIELEKQKEINNVLISDIKSIRDHIYTGEYMG